MARVIEDLDQRTEPSLATTRTIRRLLNSGQQALSRICERFSLGATENVCILFDQFEELFRYAKEIGHEESRAFIEVLFGFNATEHKNGSRPAGIYGIVTMRSDHLGDCGYYDGFAELVNNAQYLLPRMRDKDLLRAIREPARLFGSDVCSEFAIRLVREHRERLDGLPLIQHGLMRTWQLAARDGPEMSGEGALLSAGKSFSLDDMLSEHAEEMLRDVMKKDEAAERTCEYLFRAIAEIDSEGRHLRRPQTASRILAVCGRNRAALDIVLERFSRPDSSFLYVSADEDPVVDVGHEALLRCWKRLENPKIDARTGRPQGWLQRESQDGQIWRSIVTATEHDLPKHARFFRREWKVAVRFIFGKRAQWFKDLPGAEWSSPHGNRWELISSLFTLAERLRRSRKFFVLSLSATIVCMYLAIIPVTVFENGQLEREEGPLFWGMIIALGAFGLLLYTLPIAYFVNHWRSARRYNAILAAESDRTRTGAISNIETLENETL